MGSGGGTQVIVPKTELLQACGQIWRPAQQVIRAGVRGEGMCLCGVWWKRLSWAVGGDVYVMECRGMVGEGCGAGCGGNVWQESETQLEERAPATDYVRV